MVTQETITAGLETAHQLLGADARSLAAVLADITQVGTQYSRAFHRLDHFYSVAGNKQPETQMEAVRFRAGFNHDVVYHQVDQHGPYASGITPNVEAVIGHYYTHTPEGFTINANSDAMFQAVLAVFGFKEGQLLDKATGQNEFLSALYAVEQGKALGVAPKFLLAEAAHIQGTIPFGPLNHFDLLYERLINANQTLPEQERLSAAEMREVITSAVGMANADISGFEQPFGDFIRETRLLITEYAKEGASSLDRASALYEEMCRQADFFTGVLAPASRTGAMRIFHDSALRPDESIAHDEAQARENIKGLGDYLYAGAASIALAMSREALKTGDTQPLDRDVNDVIDHYRWGEAPASADGEQPDYHEGALTACAEEVLASDPLAKQLLERAGSAGVRELVQHAKAAKLFSEEGVTPEAAAQFQAQAVAILNRAGLRLSETEPPLQGEYKSPKEAITRPLDKTALGQACFDATRKPPTGYSVRITDKLLAAQKPRVR